MLASRKSGSTASSGAAAGSGTTWRAATTAAAGAIGALWRRTLRIRTTLRVVWSVSVTRSGFRSVVTMSGRGARPARRSLVLDSTLKGSSRFRLLHGELHLTEPGGGAIDQAVVIGRRRGWRTRHFGLNPRPSRSGRRIGEFAANEFFFVRVRDLRSWWRFAPLCSQTIACICSGVRRLGVKEVVHGVTFFAGPGDRLFDPSVFDLLSYDAGLFLAEGVGILKASRLSEAGGAFAVQRCPRSGFGQSATNFPLAVCPCLATWCRRGISHTRCGSAYVFESVR